MKTLLVAIPLFVGTTLLTGAEGSAKVTYVGHNAVSNALEKGGVLVKAPDLIVQGAHRSGPGQVEVHDKETDVIYMLDGEATFITGGTMIGGKLTRPGQYLGSNIQDGDTHHLVKGDIIVVPAGTPHWFKELSGPSVTYYVVKVLKQ